MPSKEQHKTKKPSSTPGSKKRTKKPQKKGSDTELLFEKWIWFQGFKYYHRFKRAGHGQFTHAHDGYGCLDIMCKVVLAKDRQNASDVWDRPWKHPACRPEQVSLDWGVQLTARSGLTARRRKIERIPWCAQWRLHIAIHETNPNPGNKKQTLHYWVFYPYDPIDREWGSPITVEFDPKEVENHWKSTASERKEKLG